MLISPNNVFILDAPLRVDHKVKPVRKIFSSNGDSITSDELLWYIHQAPGGVSGFFETENVKMEELNRVMLALVKLDDRHYEGTGRVNVNIENRPYGYGIDNFSNTLPGSLVAQVKRAINLAFGPEK